MTVTPGPALTLPDPSPNPRLKDHIFVSYSSKDRGFVDRLAEDLRSRGHTVWVDFEGIHGGEEWRQSIADGIHASARVLVVLSPESVISEWVEVELRTARTLGKTIIPLLLRPISMPGPTHPTLQYIYTDVHYRDFTRGYQQPFEDLLTDLPHPKSGVPGHCQKLIARLAALPWGMDHYIQEEARLLPLHASPYEDGVVKGQPENLLHRLKLSTRLMVLGEPGMGKTVALERLAWELASSTPPVVPIMVKLFEYDGQPLLEWIRLRLVEPGEIKLGSLDETRHFLNDMPFEAHFLLDGLNEVRPAHREQLIGEITRLALEFPRHRLVITSRVQDDAWRTLRQGSGVQDTYLVQPIREELARIYLEAHLGSDSGRRLWGQLDERMRGLAVNPLLLWLMKEAWREACDQHHAAQVKMPDNRGALYRSFVSRMLRRDDERHLNRSVTEKDRLAALERLALAMHAEKALTISCDTALPLLGNQATLDALLVNGLLLPVGDRLKFAPHQTIQEHFAACALKDTVMSRVQATGFGKLVNRVRRGVLDYANDPWWAETFIQLAGLTDDPNALARTLAEINPWLAWWCVQEGRKVDPATEETIRQRSEALVLSQNVPDRRRAAQALARLQTARVIPSLAQLSVDSDAATARTALLALFNLGEAGIRAFENVLVMKPPKQRAEWGRAIADTDPRPGVGLRPDGLPDIDWVEIPAGAFIFGDESENNGPQTLTLPAYHISRYPITYVQFQAFLDAPDGFRYPRWWVGLAQQEKKPGEQGFKYANHPRENVSWYEAVAFCRWLSSKVGYVVTLPTEQQWEKAARGTDGRQYPWGDEFDAAKCNMNRTNIRQTSAVGIFPEGESPYGILDMSGNVWEWCLTEYETGKVEVEGTGARVLRGGSFYINFNYVRAAHRFRLLPDDWLSYNGFRCARSAEG